MKGAALVLLMLVFALSAIILPATAAPEIVENGLFTPPVSAINWDVHAHTGFDSAFTELRAQDQTGQIDNSHIQLIGDTAYFFGYYTGAQSDYTYYRESDPSEKTFAFSMNFLIYPWNSNTPKAQEWHSLRSVGFLVNCVENSDNTISGYYFSFEERNGEDKIVIRMLDHVSLTALYSNSVPILSTPILAEMLLGDSTQTYPYEITSSNQAFSVKKDGVEIFSLDLSTADASQVPLGYTGGNDFGFYAGYIGSEGGHSCQELSFAVFSGIRIQTQTVVPDSALNVHFVDYKTRNDATPTEIRDDYNSTGYVGQGYTVNPLSTIGEYTYVNANAALEGTYAADPADITLYYVNPTLTIRYVDQNGKILEEAVKTGLSLDLKYEEQAKTFASYKLDDDASKSIMLTLENPDGVLEFKYTTVVPPTATPFSSGTVAAIAALGMLLILLAIRVLEFGLRKKSSEIQ